MYSGCSYRRLIILSMEHGCTALALWQRYVAEAFSVVTCTSGLLKLAVTLCVGVEPIDPFHTPLSAVICVPWLLLWGSWQ